MKWTYLCKNKVLSLKFYSANTKLAPVCLMYYNQVIHSLKVEYAFKLI